MLKADCSSFKVIKVKLPVQTSTVGVGEDSSSGVVVELVSQIEEAGQSSCGSTRTGKGVITGFILCQQRSLCFWMQSEVNL